MSENKDLLKGIVENINLIDDSKPVGAYDGLKQKAILNEDSQETENVFDEKETVDKLNLVFKPKPKTPDLVTISVTVREDQVYNIDKICKSLDKNRSEFLRELFDVVIEANS